MRKKYDYIFIGAGCAGLSLITRMIAAGLAAGKKILLIDRAPKKQNDRTWCFWEKDAGFFESVVCKEWSQLWFHGEKFSKLLSIAPYHYKMIRGIDFYNHCFDAIEQQTGIDTLFGEITDLTCTGNQLQIIINGQPYYFDCPVVFNSMYKEATATAQKGIHLLQHFKGWMIETTQPFFIAEEATLMDFRISQANGTSFVYVLPLSDKKALVEYTLFSARVLTDNEYNEGLKQYLQQFLQLTSYTITGEEFGIIPMTSASFPWYTNGMYHIGTAGGQTKASSGYTFQFIQTQSAAIVKSMQANTFDCHKQPGAVSKRFHFYDSVLLRVLASRYAGGSGVFTRLFQKNGSSAIFQFLDNESSLVTDLRIIQSLPIFPFLKAAVKQVAGG